MAQLKQFVFQQETALKGVCQADFAASSRLGFAPQELKTRFPPANRLVLRQEDRLPQSFQPFTKHKVGTELGRSLSVISQGIQRFTMTYLHIVIR
jgi:hypothetical protein